MSTTPKPAEKTVTFIQYAQPQLDDGNYQITVQQTVSSTNGDVPTTQYVDEKKYTVLGERFALNPKEVVSVFPPNTGLGEYNNVLPHVILSRPTLPWERSAGGSPSGVNDTPWLGLIVFDEKDETPTPQELTLLDLIPPSQNTGTDQKGKLPEGTYFPSFTLDYGEAWTDKCEVIDLPVDQYNNLLPTLEDLGWLAHVRQVALQDKSETYIKKVRLNSAPVVHLIYLEGFGPVLPGKDGKSNIPTTPTYDKVRLVSLMNWTFTAVSEKYTFAGLLNNINKPNGTFTQNVLRIPFSSSGSHGDEAVANALNMGFAAFNHRTRMGDNTVSWFHGPFVPFDIKTSIPFPGNSSDEFVRYNPETAMFDVSYAAAWELGRLLGLQSNNYSTALYNWKRGLTKSAIQQVEEELINLDYATITEVVSDSLSNYLGSNKKVTNKLKSMPKGEDRLAAIHATLNDPNKLTALFADNDDITVPVEVTKFLAKLKLLNGVPFNYLTPDVRMLPQESLRFFYMDTAWVDALLEGALSIGNSTSSDAIVGQAVAPMVHKAATGHAKKIRKAFLSGVKPNEIADDDNENDSSFSPTFNPTGFLLRSEVVTGWPGLEVKGYDSQGNSVDHLRMDHLGEGVLLCIFNGIVTKVEIQQHPEALHFGVDDFASPDPKDYTKSFRYIDAVDGHPAGSPVDNKKTIPPLKIPEYTRTAVSSVLKIDDLAAAMQSALSDGISYKGPFTSAEFALEMVEGVQQVTFTFSDNSSI